MDRGIAGIAHNGARLLTEEATAAAFLLGGIGTGNVSLGSRGELRDWEIFNRPNKGNRLPNTYFAIWTRRHGGFKPIARVLEAKLRPPHDKSHGHHPNFGSGLPRFDRSRLIGTFPTATVEFGDEALPVEVSLQAYTPFIPLNEEDSGIPGAVLAYRVRNRTADPVEVTVAGSLINPIGGLRFDAFGGYSLAAASRNRNEYRSDDGLSGLFLCTDHFAASDLRFGNLALVASGGEMTYRTNWKRGRWFDELQDFWDDFAADGRFDNPGEAPLPLGDRTDTCSLGVGRTLAPGESGEFRFVLAWYFPNRINGWDDEHRVKTRGREVVRTRYAARFGSAWEAAAYLVREGDRLERETLRFRDALFGGTLPAEVVDAAAANIAVLRSPTCFWLEDGTFLGYEGCFDDAGSCPGNCTHVWNYAQTLAFLFPRLERNMRRSEFLREVDGDGRMAFRAYRLFDSEWRFESGELAPPAADGQAGSVMRVYREWKLSGDDAFLRELWPAMVRAVDYALAHWDSDGDGVPDGEQHVTYDIEFYGPNPLTGVLLIGALKAMGEMAEHLEEVGLASRYRQIRDRAARRLPELCWNGEFFEQRLDDPDERKYQHGQGCLSDQLLGQQFAHLYGLGYLLPEELVRKAAYAVYRHNMRRDFSDHANCQRVYALNDERGLVLCSWPAGGRPRFPFIYSDEVWTGVEYQVAVQLIYEGFAEEGLEIVRAARGRHDGIRRNPWNEVECGHHYVRSMASWGLLIALSGFRFDMARGTMSFAPVAGADDFACFWSTAKGWGVYRQRRRNGVRAKDGIPAGGMASAIGPESGGEDEWDAEVEVLYGDMSGVRVSACGKEWTL